MADRLLVLEAQMRAPGFADDPLVRADIQLLPALEKAVLVDRMLGEFGRLQDALETERAREQLNVEEYDDQLNRILRLVKDEVVRGKDPGRVRATLSMVVEMLEKLCAEIEEVKRNNSMLDE